MTESWSWAPHVLSIELKKAVSYRVDFWIQFVVGTATDIAVAYFLWKAMFLANHTEIMQGFTFQGIIFYYLFATFAARIARGSERGYISAEIYDGGLTRYLLYPLPFLGYKLITHFSQQILAIIQLVLAFAVLLWLMGAPSEQHLSTGSFLAGIGTCLLAGYLHFVVASCIELVAFWQDVVWNLMVMLRFTIMLVGGGAVPLSFFPDWGRKLAMATPFPLIINFPVNTFLGRLSGPEWLANVGALCLWAAFFTWLLSQVWKRGTKQYSGVGI
jgi:ABC-2 type transport system permease protein